jgi:hypothetical protein
MKKGEIPKSVEGYFYLYPAFHALEVLLLLAVAIKTFNLYVIGLFIFACFFQSPLIWRYMLDKYGKPSGLFYFGKKALHGNNWMVAYQLQQFYTSFPFFERVLKMFPGFYSAWLRLWGAQIGKKVNWTSGCELVDRTHLTIGDRTLIGNHTYISAHAIKKKGDKYLLFVKDVTIGSDVVLAFQCTISPGAIIENQAFVEAGGVVYPNQTVLEGSHHERFKELFEHRFNALFKKAGRETSP